MIGVPDPLSARGRLTAAVCEMARMSAKCGVLAEGLPLRDRHHQAEAGRADATPARLRRRGSWLVNAGWSFPCARAPGAGRTVRAPSGSRSGP